MPADFSKYSNYSKENSFSSIVFGADAPLLETELNEMQQIQAERFKDYVNSIHGNIILKEGQITYENNQVTISNYTLLIDGEIVYVSNLSTSASDGDSIYIKIERTEVKYSDVLRKYGNKQEDIIENKLWDERVNQETSRRIAVTYDITTSTPSNMDKAIKMAEIIDGKLVKSYEVLNESKYNIIKTYEDVISVPNDTKGQVSVSVKGRTLFNHVNNGIDYANWSIQGTGTTKGSNGIHLVQSSSPYDFARLNINLQPNKEYTLIINIKAKTGIARLMQDASSVFGKIIAMPNNLGIHKIKFTTPTTITHNRLNFFVEGNEGDYVDFEVYAILEGDYTIDDSVNYPMSYGTKSTISAFRIRSVSEDESQESVVYVLAKDDEGNIEELRSLPNGVKDEISVTEGKLIKRVSDWINLWELEWNRHYASETENYWCMQNNDMFPNSVTVFYEDDITIVNYPHVVIPSGTTYEAYDGYAIRKNKENFRIKIPKSEIDGTIDNAKAKAWLQQNQVTLIYQLAEPEIIPVQVEGTLQAYKNGTIYFEPALSGKIIFAEGENTKQITTEELPIKSIRKVLRYDILEDGTIREVDVTEDCTHTDTTIIINNVIPNVTYFYDCDIPSEYSTSGEKIITFAENISANVEELIDYKVKNENDKRKISANIKAIESSLSNLNNIIFRDMIVISDTKPSDVAIWLEELD